MRTKKTCQEAAAHPSRSHRTRGEAGRMPANMGARPADLCHRDPRSFTKVQRDRPTAHTCLLNVTLNPVRHLTLGPGPHV